MTKIIKILGLYVLFCIGSFVDCPILVCISLHILNQGLFCSWSVIVWGFEKKEMGLFLHWSAMVCGFDGSFGIFYHWSALVTTFETKACLIHGLRWSVGVKRNKWSCFLHWSVMVLRIWVGSIVECHVLVWISLHILNRNLSCSWSAGLKKKK